MTIETKVIKAPYLKYSLNDEPIPEIHTTLLRKPSNVSDFPIITEVDNLKNPDVLIYSVTIIIPKRRVMVFKSMDLYAFSMDVT